MRTISEIISKLQEINVDLEQARYSTDTYCELNKIAKEIAQHSTEVLQCCY